MGQKAVTLYHLRFRRVLDHIDEHLDEQLDVERLCSVAAFSKHHFQRQFAALFGVSVYGYIQLIRTNPPPEDFHLDLCAATERAITPNSEGVVNGIIPAGRCAVLRLIGSSDNLRAAALFLYKEWLPQSNENTRDFPLYAQRAIFFPDVPEHEAVTDLFLPLK